MRYKICRYCGRGFKVGKPYLTHMKKFAKIENTNYLRRSMPVDKQVHKRRFTDGEFLG